MLNYGELYAIKENYNSLDQQCACYMIEEVLLTATDIHSI